MMKIKILVEISREASHAARLLSTQDATLFTSPQEVIEQTDAMKQQLSYIAGLAIAKALQEAGAAHERAH